MVCGISAVFFCASRSLAHSVLSVCSFPSEKPACLKLEKGHLRKFMLDCPPRRNTSPKRISLIIDDNRIILVLLLFYHCLSFHFNLPIGANIWGKYGRFRGKLLFFRQRFPKILIPVVYLPCIPI